jgi:hypothetical protein
VILCGALCRLTSPKRGIQRELLRQHLIVCVFALFFGASFFWCTSEAFARQTQAFVPGQSYFGRNQFVEYIAGNSPYIVSAPHGGSLTPPEIPDRTSGETVTDSNTRELVRAMGTAVFAREGRYPHIIICHLRRTKLDVNRDLGEALEGSNPYAIQAWKEFQSFIDTAKQTVVQQFGKGFYVDVHGHGHEIQRLELGYLLSSSALALGDNTLNSNSFYGSSSSIRSMIAGTGTTFAQLLRGPHSLGTLLEERGFPSVPSQNQPNPGTAPYFSGGYNTQRHGSAGGGPISGVQIECNFTGVRDTEQSWLRFADAFAGAIRLYTSTMMFPTAVERRTAFASQFRLMQNYPNPFNPSTSFDFQVSSYEFVSLKVFDVLGREVATLIDEYRRPGTYSVRLNATGMPSGVYFYRMRAGGFADTKKMILGK